MASVQRDGAALCRTGLDGKPGLADSAFIAFPTDQPESTMSSRLIHRSLSLAFAFVLTVATLGGIDSLTVPAERAPQWAQQSAPRA
jgi:hypothetical protein